MKHRAWPLWIWRFCLALFALGAVWSVWSSVLAQAPSTNAPAQTNAVTTLADRVAGRDFVASHQSELSFGLSRIPALQTPFLGNPLWQYIASLIYLVLAFVVSKALDQFIKARLQAWAARTANHWDDLLVNLLHGPVKVITFVVLLHIGLQLFDWPTTAERYISRITFVIVAASLVYVLLKTVDAAMGLWKGRLKEDGDKAFNVHFITLVGKGLKAVLCVVAALTLLQNLGINITAILGSVSVLGLALGLAAQDTVANLFGAVAVFLDKPFRVGDRIRVGSEVDGTVEEMGLRATRVRTLDGFLVTVPNKSVGNNTVTNITARPTIRGVLDIGITYDTSADRVRLALRILRELLETNPKTNDFNVHFNRFGDFFLNLNVVWICNTTDWKEFTGLLQELNLQIKERFDAEGIEFAFPTQTLYLRKEGEAQR